MYRGTISEIWQIIGPIFTLDGVPLFNTLVGVNP